MPTQSTDHIATSGNDGIDFTMPGETWTIDPGILVYSPDTNGVHSSLLGSTLINNGLVKSGSDIGASFNGGLATISNNAGAEIIGDFIGLLVIGDGVTIHNGGSILGLGGASLGLGVTFGLNSNHVVLTNTGDIYGRLAGVIAESKYEGGGVIHNSGLIRSSSAGIEVATPAGLTTTITNDAGGVIDGGVNGAISTEFNSGGFFLKNHGTLNGAIFSNAAGQADVVVNVGAIHGAVYLGGGNDTFKGRGGTSGAVYGETGNDRLIGGSHNDFLHGGDGKDTLTGGPGKDQFFFDTALNAATNVDRITDFTHGVDKIDLSHAIFTATNPSGTLHPAMFSPLGTETAATRVIYHPGNGFLFYDQDGSGHAHAPIHFATLAAHLTLTNTDFIVVA